MSRDTRTIANTSQDEIQQVLDRAAERKNKAWKKPRVCAAPECKNVFTPSREWHKYCCYKCQQAVNILRVQAEARRPLVLIAEQEKEIKELKDRILELEAEIKTLKEVK